MKAKIDGKTIATVTNWYAEKEIDKKIKKSLRQQKIADLVADGIDKQLAADMVDCGLV